MVGVTVRSVLVSARVFTSSCRASQCAKNPTRRRYRLWRPASVTLKVNDQGRTDSGSHRPGRETACHWPEGCKRPEQERQHYHEHATIERRDGIRGRSGRKKEGLPATVRCGVGALFVVVLTPVRQNGAHGSMVSIYTMIHIASVAVFASSRPAQGLNRPASFLWSTQGQGEHTNGTAEVQRMGR